MADTPSSPVAVALPTISPGGWEPPGARPDGAPLDEMHDGQRPRDAPVEDAPVGDAPVTGSPVTGSPEILSEATLGRLLGALASRPGPVPKYRYPSAGTLYPVQAYVVLRQDLGSLAAGSYYHDPDEHALVKLSAGTPVGPDGSMPAAPDGSTPAALLMLVAQTAAIEPIYGAETAGFCLLEAGYMNAALQESAGGLRLRDAGDPGGHGPLREKCALEPGHVPLVCWAIGENVE